MVYYSFISPIVATLRDVKVSEICTNRTRDVLLTYEDNDTDGLIQLITWIRNLEATVCNERMCISLTSCIKNDHIVMKLGAVQVPSQDFDPTLAQKFTITAYGYHYDIV
jgi:hypothetical protein